MEKVTRKRYEADFKAKVALDAVKGEQTRAELAARHGVHQTMIAGWRRQAIEGLASTFSSKAELGQANSEAELSRLHAKIGQVVERDFLAKASGRRALNGGVRRRTQNTDGCRLFGNARSGKSEDALALMRLIEGGIATGATIFHVLVAWRAMPITCRYIDRRRFGSAECCHGALDADLLV